MNNEGKEPIHFMKETPRYTKVIWHELLSFYTHFKNRADTDAHAHDLMYPCPRLKDSHHLCDRSNRGKYQSDGCGQRTDSWSKTKFGRALWWDNQNIAILVTKSLNINTAQLQHLNHHTRPKGPAADVPAPGTTGRPQRSWEVRAILVAWEGHI